MTAVQPSAQDTTTAITTATEVTSAEDMTPSIYPLLDIGTAASVDTTDGKEKTRGQRRNRSKKALKQSMDRQAKPRAPGTLEDCPQYQSFLPFELIYRKADQGRGDLDDFGINGCRYTATKYGVSRE
ncbi:uncharacterized protein ColSpa_02913 [Colletotrichum spaethianum]|uniref:Uncharacterized protein n=1 Tax=Colletotrichum spaethianum TaxID=700344 RepID=A0AA37LEG5_9PEZI|nr:uncharacterized protein ColSpa_02913 [Colletotrichum spaethianum]GKT42732.1 hypothetical protein ColSpa_02913 [Colletotrichum spaethianum]